MLGVWVALAVLFAGASCVVLVMIRRAKRMQ